ncbi:MAG: flagellar M-ring protein FliF [Treponema sp.]|jgi:flagellar M-ring protein FliF|nr:flagellar M-ring protein FliF [Treponema sp.]
MRDFFKKLLGQLSGLWGKWSMLQRIILIGIGVVALAGTIALVSLSGAPNQVAVISTPIRDQGDLDRIVARIDQENVEVTVSSAGVVMVPDAATARRMRSILISEGLVPSGTDPWAAFSVSSWTITDFERNVNLQQAITKTVTEHIKALDGVDNANVIIVVPEKTLFQAEQLPYTASVILTPKPGSDITQNRQKIEGIQKLLKFAVTGLTDDNIVIADQNGNILNDFTGMAAMDRLALINEELKTIQRLEAQYRARILSLLQSTFTSDRVRDLNVKIEMDMSPKTVETEEYFPVTITEDNPSTPYDDSQRVESLTRSQTSSSTTYEGTGYNPEGPAGVEGQTAPAYQDMSNLYGRVTQETSTQNNELNRRITQEEKSPSIDRVTVSVNIDGKWKINYDADNKPVILPDGSIDRIFTPISAEELSTAQRLIQNAIGYSVSRGDSVTVGALEIDRSRQFAEEDEVQARRKQIQTLVIIFLAGLAGLLLLFIAFRIIARELERRRRIKEEELAAQQQAMRENAILEAENAGEGMEVSMSVEERRRMELQEHAANMAREHTSDVAQLIRTWLLEE